MLMKLTVINHSSRAVPRAFLDEWFRRLLILMKREVPPERLRARELVIAFVSTAESRRLNREFRRRDRPTDVLSFDSDEPGVFGELVICFDVIVRQAREHGLSQREELGYMVLHGFLHLLGFDHEGSRIGARRMFAIQDRVFDRLRVPPFGSRRVKA